LVGQELKNRKERQKTVFLTDETQMRQKIERLLPNLDRLEKSAESHYRDLRVRSEFAFRQELLKFIENQRSQKNFFENQVSYVLNRMQNFWAFKGAYLLNYSPETEEVSTIAVSILGEANAFGFPGINGHNLKIQLEEFHPCPYLHFRGHKPHSVSSPLNQAIPMIEKIVDKNNGTKLTITTGDCEFLVVIPTIRGVYTFVFAVRDQREVSSLEHLRPGSISDLCQDMIFETCGEIVGEFHNVREFVERDKQIQIKCLETLNQRIKEETKTVSLPLDLLLESMLQDDNIESIKGDLREVAKRLPDIVSVPNKFISEELMKLKPSRQT